MHDLFQYEGDLYPTFVTGPSYVVSKDAVGKVGLYVFNGKSRH